ncbi:dihydropteroate synthase [Methanogenium sp. S4BF]|uniref:dihydropteroate synthase n=1 Tax=Methanogenium sp. S4BF TaxID=1789226 RepID=UPI002415EA83|nr:dihydropteroate synthase [Methanogenium sp. S4BF]WFN35428.1 dihydropteroate synthase [Methanogenium sp. S4BF]
MLTCRIGNITVGKDAPVRLMAVINASPESFFSKSFVPPGSVLHTVQKFSEDGADIIDIGARSTAPNSPQIPVHTERERVTEVLTQIEGTGIPVSLDTMHPEVLNAALRYDIAAINDIHGLANPEYARIAGDSGLAVISMASEIVPGDVKGVNATLAALSAVIGRAEKNGIEELILDPAIGKWIPERTFEDDWELCRHFSDFHELQRPLLAAVSRKSFIGDLTGRSPEDRLAGTLAVTCTLMDKGASLIRAHDIRETADIIRVHQKLNQRI